MDVVDDEDGISKITLNAKNVYGKQMHFPEMDKICGIVVRIRKNDDVEESRNKLIAMLEDMLSTEDGVAKKNLLEEKYGMRMTANWKGE